jgi:DNA-binding MarR family transcriptional regulator
MNMSSRSDVDPEIVESVSVAQDLHSLAIRLLRKLRKEDIRAGIGPARLSALSILVFSGRSTIGELAAAEQVKAPTMTRIVTGLERDGLARRDRDRKDGRSVSVVATPKGRRLLLRARDRRVSTLARQLEALSEDEISVLRDGVEILNRLFRP